MALMPKIFNVKFLLSYIMVCFSVLNLHVEQAGDDERWIGSQTEIGTCKCTGSENGPCSIQTNIMYVNAFACNDTSKLIVVFIGWYSLWGS